MSGGRGGGGFSGSSGRGGGGGYSGGRSGSSSGSSGFIGGVSVGHGHGSDSAATPDDCVVAKAVNKELKPSVDCFYSWEHWHWDNFLLYVIRITPTGQNSQGWTQGILDNIRGECGRGHVKYFFAEKRWHNSNEDFGEQRKINGTTFKGLEMTVPLGEWTAGEDETACVAEAIRKASCGVELNFTNGSCYRKPGTLLPITLN
ncbi:hypothetical protein Daus18300_000061 [Diaporthe australafricana]|uniref:Uncharacterized protein n=1 Tax=Diaporthe australafricana TaxID=127596 RepID=A0ABR3Y7C4_9PEZI